MIPRRAALVLPAIVLALLATASVVASNGLAQVVRAAQPVLGPDRSWIEHAATGKVAYLFDDGPFWNIAWQERFWNPSIDRVYSVSPAVVPGPMPQTPVTVPASGRLPLTERFVVATDTHTFVGTRIAHLAQQGLDTSGLGLWRLDGVPRLSTTIRGIQPNGDMTVATTMTVYDCRSGTLTLTLLPKATSVVRILFDGKLVLEHAFDGASYWNGSVPVPPGPHPTACMFTIVPQALLGSTRVEFERG